MEFFAVLIDGKIPRAFLLHGVYKIRAIKKFEKCHDQPCLFASLI